MPSLFVHFYHDLSSAGRWTQDLVHSRQVLLHLATSPSPQYVNYRHNFLKHIWISFNALGKCFLLEFCSVIGYYLCRLIIWFYADFIACSSKCCFFIRTTINYIWSLRHIVISSPSRYYIPLTLQLLCI